MLLVTANTLLMVKGSLLDLMTGALATITMTNVNFVSEIQGEARRGKYKTPS